MRIMSLKKPQDFSKYAPLPTLRQINLYFRNKMHVGLLDWETNSCSFTPTWNRHETILQIQESVV